MSVIISAIVMFWFARFMMSYMAATQAPERSGLPLAGFNSPRRPNIYPWLPAWRHRPLTDKEREQWRLRSSAASFRKRLALVRCDELSESYWSLLPLGFALAAAFMLLLGSVSKADALPMPVWLPLEERWRFLLMLLVSVFAIALAVCREWLNSEISYWLIDRAPHKLLDSRFASVFSFTAISALLAWCWTGEEAITLLATFFAAILSLQTRFWQFWVHFVSAVTLALLAFAALLLASIWPVAVEATRLWPLLLVVAFAGVVPAAGAFAAALFIAASGDLDTANRSSVSLLAVVIPLAYGVLVLLLQRAMRAAEFRYGAGLSRPNKQLWLAVTSSVGQSLLLVLLLYAALIIWMYATGVAWPLSLGSAELAAIAFAAAVALSPLLRLAVDMWIAHRLLRLSGELDEYILQQKYGALRWQWRMTRVSRSYVLALLSFGLFWAFFSANRQPLVEWLVRLFAA